MRTSEKKTIHSDAAAATNQSVLKDVLETTRLQDTFPSSSIAAECVPQVADVQAQHVTKEVSTGRHMLYIKLQYDIRQCFKRERENEKERDKNLLVLNEYQQKTTQF